MMIFADAALSGLPDLEPARIHAETLQARVTRTGSGGMRDSVLWSLYLDSDTYFRSYGVPNFFNGENLKVIDRKFVQVRWTTQRRRGLFGESDSRTILFLADGETTYVGEKEAVLAYQASSRQNLAIFVLFALAYVVMYLLAVPDENLKFTLTREE